MRTLLGTSADAPILALTRWMVAYPSHKYFSKYFDLLSEVLRICGRAAATTMFRCVYIPRALVDEIECTLAELPEPPTIGALQPIFAVLRWSRQTYAHPDEMSTAYFYGGESERLVGLIDSLIRLYPRISPHTWGWAYTRGRPQPSHIHAGRRGRALFFGSALRHGALPPRLADVFKGDAGEES